MTNADARRKGPTLSFFLECQMLLLAHAVISSIPTGSLCSFSTIVNRYWIPRRAETGLRSRKLRMPETPGIQLLKTDSM